MSLEAKVGDGEKKAVSVELSKDGTYEVTVDGRSFSVNALEIGRNFLHLNIDGRIAEVGTHQNEMGFDIRFGGRSYGVDIADPRRRALKGTGSDSDGPMDVVSPMPGKVIRVLIEPGQVVNKGDGLVIVEAMKMENEYKAARDGVVADVFVTAGQTIEAGAKMVRLQAPTEA